MIVNPEFITRNVYGGLTWESCKMHCTVLQKKDLYSPFFQTFTDNNASYVPESPFSKQGSFSGKNGSYFLSFDWPFFCD